MPVCVVACDLCGEQGTVRVLESPRLDGPLVRCSECGLLYVQRREHNLTFSALDPSRSAALAEKVIALKLVNVGVEEAERGRRRAVERARMAWFDPFARGGALLDVGCSSGAFLDVARERFAVHGVEPDPATAAQAQASGLAVTAGTLADVVAPAGGFDVLTMFHVVEHLDSPRQTLLLAHDLLRPGGVLVIETPTVDSLLFRATRNRWRQLIPDHYYFYSRETLTRTLESCGFEPVATKKVGRRVSLRFLADRLRRNGLPLPARAGAARDAAARQPLDLRAARRHRGPPLIKSRQRGARSPR